VQRLVSEEDRALIRRVLAEGLSLCGGCGHDVANARLLGAAILLHFSGSRLLFQRLESLQDGGDEFGDGGVNVHSP